MVEKKPIPPLTCSHIDRVIEIVDSILNIAKEPETSEVVLSSYGDIIKAEMEFIRNANDELRDSSAHWYAEYKKRATRRR